MVVTTSASASVASSPPASASTGVAESTSSRASIAGSSRRSGVASGSAASTPASADIGTSTAPASSNGMPSSMFRNAPQAETLATPATSPHARAKREIGAVLGTPRRRQAWTARRHSRRKPPHQAISFQFLPSTNMAPQTRLSRVGCAVAPAVAHGGIQRNTTCEDVDEAGMFSWIRRVDDELSLPSSSGARVRDQARAEAGQHGGASQRSASGAGVGERDAQRIRQRLPQQRAPSRAVRGDDPLEAQAALFGDHHAVAKSEGDSFEQRQVQMSARVRQVHSEEDGPGRLVPQGRSLPLQIGQDDGPRRRGDRGGFLVQGLPRLSGGERVPKPPKRSAT